MTARDGLIFFGVWVLCSVAIGTAWTALARMHKRSNVIEVPAERWQERSNVTRLDVVKQVRS